VLSPSRPGESVFFQDGIREYIGIDMKERVQTKHFTASLLDLLDETFESVQGIYLDKGTSLLETLATLSADEASLPIGEKCAMIATQVEHVIFYLEVLERYYMDDEVEKVDWGQIWSDAEPINQEDWISLQEDLKDTYYRIKQRIIEFDGWDEDKMTDVMAMLIHTAYHLGEIRQAMCYFK
jgi:hypothetical protein